MTLLVDTHAWMDYFEGSARGARVKARIDEAEVIYTCPMVVAELASKYTRALGAAESKRRTDHVLHHSVMIEHTLETALAAGSIHAELKPRVEGIGLADCFILACARSKSARVLTGDPHFAGLDDAVVL